MKILQVHNYYQLPGGEDIVVSNEKKLLESFGHTVIQYTRHNSEIENYSLREKFSLFKSTYWSKKSFSEISAIIKKEEPDICHVHNYLPLISPSVFYACKENNIPVVQTLHNYRMLCANAYLFRNGSVCEECLGKSLCHSVKYGCYRNSRIQTYVVASSMEKHKQRGTFDNFVDAYICLTEFQRNKMIEGGISELLLQVKSNFIHDDPGFENNSENFLISAGRLDIQKGTDILIKSIDRLENDIKIMVAGSGPSEEQVKTHPKINYAGQLSHNELIQNLKKSYALIFPSVCFEGMPLTIMEAFACGKPVIASRLGAMEELITEGYNGLLFEPGNPEELAQKINRAAKHPEEIKRMGENARKEFEEKYTADMNYKLLIDIYQKVIERKN